MRPITYSALAAVIVAIASVLTSWAKARNALGRAIKLNPKAGGGDAQRVLATVS